jgi:MFS family permease
MGIYADRHGRRSALLVSVMLMCFGSLVIALCPSYDVIGVGSCQRIMSSDVQAGSGLPYRAHAARTKWANGSGISSARCRNGGSSA